MPLILPGEVLYEDLALQGDVYIGPPTTPGAYYLIDGLDPADVLSITVPGGLTYEAWSRWASNGFNGGLTWENGFWVTTDSDITTPYLDSYPATTTYFATPAEAAAYAAVQPATLLTGSSSYKIHFNDWVVNLNRGGLSLRIEKLPRTVPSPELVSGSFAFSGGSVSATIIPPVLVPPMMGVVDGPCCSCDCGRIQAAVLTYDDCFDSPSFTYTVELVPAVLSGAAGFLILEDGDAILDETGEPILL